MFVYDISLVTKNGPSPATYSDALVAFTSPAPCTRGSFPMSLAVDISIFFIVNGVYGMSFVVSCSIIMAATPAIRGADMDVPPNSLYGSSSESTSVLVTIPSEKPKAPMDTRSGFVSPIIPGPLLEKSTK